MPRNPARVRVLPLTTRARAPNGPCCGAVPPPRAADAFPADARRWRLRAWRWRLRPRRAASGVPRAAHVTARRLARSRARHKLLVPPRLHGSRRAARARDELTTLRSHALAPPAPRIPPARPVPVRRGRARPRVPASPGGELDRFSSAYLWSIRHAAKRCKYALNAAQVRSVPRTIVLSRRRQGWVRFPPASCDQDRQNNALRSARVTPARGNGARHFTPDATIHDPARHE